MFGRHRADLPVEPTYEAELAARVARAADEYRQGHYGRGEYELVRVGLILARQHGDAAAEETLSTLKFVHVPGPVKSAVRA